MRNYSAARGTFFQDYPLYYAVIGAMLKSNALANLAERNI